MLTATLVADRTELTESRALLNERIAGGVVRFGHSGLAIVPSEDQDVTPTSLLVTLRRLADELAEAIELPARPIEEEVWFAAFELGRALDLEPRDAMAFAGAQAFGGDLAGGE